MNTERFNKHIKNLFYINIKKVPKFNYHGQKKSGEREREYKQCRLAIVPSGVLSLLLIFRSFCRSRRE